ncbi:hypothetical protein [uncultured Desulfuromonas sp.]|uniref:hypothetical protein n=1 Tax=uncultured Desulfuromonas sp. TaxID=181013 RepID=UPI002AAA969D|nr:hypothetical protein [uncultured Desulfuromonas sp.]
MSSAPIARRLQHLLSWIAALLLSGCASQPPLSPTKEHAVCTKLWLEFEQQVSTAGVRDVASQSIDGFSYLRSDRFLADRMRQADSVTGQRFLAQQMRQRDLDARYRELLRLPEQAQQELSLRAASPDPIALKATLSRCSAQLMRDDFADETVYSRLQQAMEIKDDYRFWQRTLGLYPLFILPVGYLANNAHEEIRQQVEDFSETSLVSEHTLWYAPQTKQPLPAKTIKAIVTSSRDNGAGLHQLNEGDRQRLAASFAPELRQIRDKESDLIGAITAVAQNDDAVRFTVNTDTPVVYYYFSEIMLQGLPALQINYVFWYPGRYNGASSWIERGHLDGITLRYTLDRNGRPVMVDLINNCGCYYGMVPDADYFDLENLKDTDKRDQILQTLPHQAQRQRLLFTFSPRHLLLNARMATKENGTEQHYQLRPYEELELLPIENGAFTSLFDERGIVPGTKRIEAGLLFSMGIPEVGSMRQRGHQPITLIGREHFDDPQLFDNLFHYLQEPPHEDEFIRKQGSGLTRRVNTMKALSQGR